MSKTLNQILLESKASKKSKRLRNPVTVVGVKKKTDGSYDEYEKTIEQLDDDVELTQFVDACENDVMTEGVLSSITTATGLVLGMKYSREVKSTRPSIKNIFTIKQTDNLREMIPDLNDALQRMSDNQKAIDEAHHKRQYAMAKLSVVGVAMSRLFLKKKKR